MTYPFVLDLIYNKYNYISHIMRLSLKSEYALLALVFLVRQADQGLIPVRLIAEACRVSPPCLEQILLQLKRAGYTAGTRGRNGGYRLARPASEITLAAIVRLLDGPLAPTDSASAYFHRETPVSRDTRLLKVFQQIRDSVCRIMESTTLADIT